MKHYKLARGNSEINLTGGNHLCGLFLVSGGVKCAGLRRFEMSSWISLL